MGIRAQIIFAVTAFVSLATGLTSASPAVTVRVSVNSDGVQANAFSGSPALSADGRFVAFESSASNLLSGEAVSNHVFIIGVFVHDRQTGATERVSVSGAGQRADQNSFNPAISGDGRFVAFTSPATNLSPGVDYGVGNAFVRDRLESKTELISVGMDGDSGNLDSGWPAISDDGRFVAFASQASNLVPGDTNDRSDVFVRDRSSAAMERANVSDSGSESDGEAHPAVAISGDGRFVAFESSATNLVPGEANPIDVFLRDREAGTTRRLNVGPNGENGDGGSCCPGISRGGRFIAFISLASNLVPGRSLPGKHAYVHDLATGKNEVIDVAPSGSPGDASSESVSLSISADGRYIPFVSKASDLVPGDTNGAADVFVRDRQMGTTQRVNLGDSGQQSGSGVIPYFKPMAISGDGRFVAFESADPALVPGDTNNATDIFVHDRVAALQSPPTTPTPTTAGLPRGGGPPVGDSSGQSWILVAGLAAAVVLLTGLRIVRRRS